jgi:hypothetical protein
VENVKDEGEGEEEEQWLAVETMEAGGELRDLLSTVLYYAMFLFFFFGQWRMQKMREKKKWLAVKTEEAGGELLSTVHMQRE